MARFALGLAALGRPGYINLGHGADLEAGGPVTRGALEDNARAVLDAAYAAGVRHVDTARSYGIGEEILAGWLDARGHRDVFVSTKWGYRYVAALRADAPVHEVKDHSVEHLRAQWRETHALFGPRVGLWQIHSATRAGGVLKDAAVLDELARIRAAHDVRIGVSVTGPAQHEAVDDALTVTRDGAPLFTAVQATWNLLEPSVGPALVRAHGAGVTVIVKEALANGRLGPRGDADAFLAIARAHRVAPDALALAAVAAQPFVHVVLLGATTAAQLASNLDAQKLPQTHPGALADALALLQSVTPGSADTYWRARAALPWT